MELISYLLKVSVCTVLFFAVYLVVLRRLTFFRINRFYLLTTLFLSFLIPVLSFTVKGTVIDIPAVHSLAAGLTDEIETLPIQVVDQIAAMPVVSSSPTWYPLLTYLYFGGVGFCLAIASWRAMILFRHLKNSKIRVNGLWIISKTAGFTNCSFFNCVFVDDENLTSSELRVIVAHEKVHAEQLHSIDKVLLIVAKALLWFNPMVYLFDRALAQAHEYEADEETSQCFGTPAYANLLLRLAAARNEMPLVHNFVENPLKERIKMLFKSKSNDMKKLMYLLALPIGMGLLWGFTIDGVEVSNTPKYSSTSPADGKEQRLDHDLFKKQLKGEIKGIEQTEVGEILRFKYGSKVIPIFKSPRQINVKVGDEVFVTIAGILQGLQIIDAKAKTTKELYLPCYTIARLTKATGEVLYDSKDAKFTSKYHKVNVAAH